MAALPIRTITLGIAEAHPLSASVILHARGILHQARTRFTDAGYTVQTVRLSTRPLFEDLADYTSAQRFDYCKTLQRMLDDADLPYCSLGAAPAARPDFPLEHLETIVDILAAARSCSATVQLASLAVGLRQEAALPTAHIIQRLARETTGGDGNFRFAMLACVPPGGPFFPAAYHAGPASLSLGFQGASLLTDALLPHEAELALRLDQRLITQWIRETIHEHVAPIVTLAQGLAAEQKLLFGGIDLSPAPMADDSVVPALELGAGGPLGSPGTLATAAAITAALKSTSFPACGYCGLMLPVLEDALLGKRWEEERVNLYQLLLYSAVCGTGLDTVPLPGDCSDETISHLLLDVATLALRLQKPLSARLFPVSGRRAGEYTNFQSPYLTNTRIH